MVPDLLESVSTLAGSEHLEGSHSVLCELTDIPVQPENQCRIIRYHIRILKTCSETDAGMQKVIAAEGNARVLWKLAATSVMLLAIPVMTFFLFANGGIAEVGPAAPQEAPNIKLFGSKFISLFGRRLEFFS